MRIAVTGIFWTAIGVISSIMLVLSAAFLYLNPQVPEASSFKNVKLRAPLRIYTADNKLIQEFGERLTPVTYQQIPQTFVNALLDTEDKRFFKHNGIDLITVGNAAWQLIRNKGSIKTGASTITMQLVKNISGDTEVRFIRKFKEMLLALKIERELTKEEILTLYLNIIPFGKHAFGIQAAANTYYGKNVDQLDLAQIAMLAGVPQAPEAGNPVNGPARAIERRNLVLSRMLEQQSINQQEYIAATKAPITASVHHRVIEMPTLYAAEMVRQQILKDYGTSAYNNGLIIHTTIDSIKQQAAESAITVKLNEYDRRHGYRGPEFRQIDGTSEYIAAPEYGYPTNYVKTLANARIRGNQKPGIVLSVADQQISVLTQELRVISIPWSGIRWARPYITPNKKGPRPKVASDILAIGDVIRYQQQDGVNSLGQVPKIQGALVSLNPRDGAILALVGGYDFKAQQFNHVTQAHRQPGSNFKPFYYAGAMENGLTAASIFNDAPLVLDGGEQEQVYRPKNSGGFDGNLRLREALYKSKNMVSLRVILEFGATNAIDYVKRFGFDTSNFPPDVQLAFGGGTIALTPLEVATGYAAFANGGYKVSPYLIANIKSINQNTIYSATPDTVCDKSLPQLDCKLPSAERIIESRVAYVMDSILSDVITRGTGKKVLRALNRRDLKGKTGTTNDADIWFSGYTNDLVTTTWTGFDNNSPVGNREYGSTTPLETWVEYMREVLPPETETRTIPLPDSLVTVRINPVTGDRATSTDPNAIFEMFREEYAPANPARQEQITTQNRPVQQIF
ncbi:MAG: PBP1A family penicillin-binding protein [Pseudomonadales bacterium]|nr:PBP1A family penicillin-binding protein [Pseudomonadales bacterium]